MPNWRNKSSIPYKKLVDVIPLSKYTTSSQQSGEKWRKVVNMFYGEFEHNIDKKGRLIIPSKFREIYKDRYTDKLYITRGLDKCLFLFTEEEWKLQEKKFKDLSFTKGEARKFNRLYFSGASEVVCDAQGRILIPQYLFDYAFIKDEVMVVGVSDRVEIWSKEKWKSFFDDSIESFETLAEKLIDKE